MMMFKIVVSSSWGGAEGGWRVRIRTGEGLARGPPWRDCAVGVGEVKEMEIGWKMREGWGVGSGDGPGAYEPSLLQISSQI